MLTPKKLSKALKKARGKRSVYDVSKCLGWPEGSLRAVESGKHVVTSIRLHNLLDELGVSITLGRQNSRKKLDIKGL